MKKILICLISLFLLVSMSAEARSFSRHHGGYGFKYHTAFKKQPRVKYHTYAKPHLVTNDIYTGRTSGTGTTKQNLARRDQNHHRNQDGYGPAYPDKTSYNKEAIRGREQQMIEKYRREGRAAKQINGVSPKNPKGPRYSAESIKEFGPP